MIADLASPQSPQRPPYAPPRVTRVAVRTSRDHLNWQYAGESVCTGHNHDAPGGSGSNGCSFPQ